MEIYVGLGASTHCVPGQVVNTSEVDTVSKTQSNAEHLSSLVGIWLPMCFLCRRIFNVVHLSAP